MARKKKSNTRKSSHRRRSQGGKGVLDKIKSGLKFAKDHRLLSTALAVTPYQTAARIAQMAGLGRKRRKSSVRRRVSVFPTLTIAPGRKRRGSVAVRAPRVSRRRISRAQVGRGFFSDLGGGLGSLASGIGSGIGGIFGRGRKSRTSRRKNVIAI
jgi:hypothetical protein